MEEPGTTVLPGGESGIKARIGDHCMSRIQFVLPSLLATFTVSVVASASAATHNYQVERTELIGSEEVEGNSQEGKLETTMGGTALMIQCQEDYAPNKESTIETAGKSKVTKLEFRQCIIYQAKNKIEVLTCTVKEPVTAEALDELTGQGEDTLKEKGIGPLSKLTIEGTKCGLGNPISLEVKGTVLCTAPGFALEEVTHELICTPGGSTLKFGIETARLWSNTWIKLRSAKKWSFG
jgi:hypothetical protein